jgi:hypothetical protein
MRRTQQGSRIERSEIRQDLSRVSFREPRSGYPEPMDTDPAVAMDCRFARLARASE